MNILETKTINLACKSLFMSAYDGEVVIYESGGDILQLRNIPTALWLEAAANMMRSRITSDKGLNSSEDLALEQLYRSLKDVYDKTPVISE